MYYSRMSLLGVQMKATVSILVFLFCVTSIANEADSKIHDIICDASDQAVNFTVLFRPSHEEIITYYDVDMSLPQKKLKFDKRAVEKEDGIQWLAYEFKDSSSDTIALFYVSEDGSFVKPISYKKAELGFCRFQK